jgi:hypothetical protein
MANYHGCYMVAFRGGLRYIQSVWLLYCTGTGGEVDARLIGAISILAAVAARRLKEP